MNTVFDDLKVGDLWDGAAYVDDWYAIQKIDKDTVIIGEPKSSQYNSSYLIIGENEAILYDTGAGERGNDTKPISEFILGYTDKPIRVVLSHFHFDHTGGVNEFDGITMIDLPYIRKRTRNGTYQVSLLENLDTQKPSLRVKDWVKHEEVIDLGDREIQFLNMPGHAPESIVLIDHTRKYVFTGDLVYQHLGGIVVFTPGSDPDHYIESTDDLVKKTGSDYRFFGAHGLAEFSQTWLVKVRDEFQKVKSGKVHLRLASSSLQPIIPLRLHAKDQLLIYFTPFSSPAKIFSWRFATILVAFLLLLFGLALLIFLKL